MVRIPYILFIIFILMVGCGGPKIETLKVNNPNKHEFDFGHAEVIGKLRELVGKKFISPFSIIEEVAMDYSSSYASSRKTGNLLLIVNSHNSSYHILTKASSPATWDDMGYFQGSYIIKVGEGNDKCVVEVLEKELTVVSGSEQKLDAHGISKERRVWSKVPTAKYYEYLFLLELGKLLGEKGMPPIKTK